MRKLIIGIAAVCFGQIVFQLAMSADRIKSDLAVVAATSQLAQPVTRNYLPAVDVASLDTNIASREPTTITAGGRTSVARRTYTSPRDAYASVRRVDRPRFTAEAMVAQFKPVEITYRAPSAPETASFDRIRDKGQDDKRSTGSRALSVLKKPYDLVKFLGSKLH